MVTPRIFPVPPPADECRYQLGLLGGSFVLSSQLVYRGALLIQQRELDAEGLPPLAPDASDNERGRVIEARMAARHGAPSIEDYRRAYAGFGAEWPGDGEIRRRHIVALTTAA